MIIVKLMGGMGNQMFQYALYKVLLEHGRDVRLDREKYTHWDERRECFLDYGCFDLGYELCTKAEARKYVFGTGMAARVLMRLFGDRDTHYYEKNEYQYDPAVMDLQEGYLDGFWQSWKYFQSIKEKIMADYKFVNILSGRDYGYGQQIKNTNSVAVHIRRGDYLKLQSIYGNICTEDYYKNAIMKMCETIKNPVFYFFSNDMGWAKMAFGHNDNYIYVEGNGENRGYIDMQLMSECRHQIIANSSFSWWAAFLNGNPDKVVICPKRWINTRETPDVYCDGWVLV